MGKCLVIKTDNSVIIEDLPDNEHLGGYISNIVRWQDYEYFERVQFYSAKCQMWCNEAALCLQPPPPLNNIINIICRDPILGNVVITGLDDEKGDVLPINENIEEFANSLKNIVNEDNELKERSTIDTICMLAQKYKFVMFG